MFDHTAHSVNPMKHETGPPGTLNAEELALCKMNLLFGPVELSDAEFLAVLAIRIALANSGHKETLTFFRIQLLHTGLFSGRTEACHVFDLLGRLGLRSSEDLNREIFC